MEEWKDLEDFPNHQVSSYGNIRNKKNGYVLKPHNDRYGYPTVSIGNANNVSIHKLVCLAFNGEKPSIVHQVNHIDCNRSNNHAENLEWVTPSENIKWATTHGYLNPYEPLKKAVESNKKKVCIVETGECFNSVKECAEYLHTKPQYISRVLRNVDGRSQFHGQHFYFAKKEGN